MTDDNRITYGDDGKLVIEREFPEVTLQVKESNPIGDLETIQALAGAAQFVRENP